LALGQQNRPGGNWPGNNFPGTFEVEGAADGNRAARRGRPGRHGPVMKSGNEMLVAVYAKSMLK
jgi:hypothetical protein